MPAPDLELALRIADRADAITRDYFRSDRLALQLKADQTPVTAADKAVEEMARELLGAERPGEAILGEEYGGDAAESCWFLDPIDGTKNFSRGLPVYATLIAHQTEGRVDCGVVSAPALGQRWWAATGGGAFCNGEAIHVATTATLADAHLSCTDARDFAEHGRQPQFDALLAEVRYSRAFGDFWSHMLVAEGRLDIGIEPVVNAWDVAPMAVILPEAGGTFSDLDGAAGLDGGSILTSNTLLHPAVLEMMRRR